ncbi:MAG: hypothetical protein IJM08_00625 [Firmicutes bacterium]|nr:hypothetical protein [Bacillota bacterium]
MMKNIIKAFSVLLVLALLMGLAGCGKKEEPVVMSSPGGLYKVDKSGEAIIDDVDLSALGLYEANKDSLTPAEDNARVFYEIFVGSFSDSNEDGIGDLKGIINRLDYLNDGDPKSGKSLGIEGIWLTPIFTSRSYHKYDVNDYYEIDPEFGSMEDLKALIEGCHQRGIKLILDLVINHTGSSNPWYLSFIKAHRSEDKSDLYYDFYSYYRQGSEVPAGKSFTQIAGTDVYVECNFDSSMPELNYDDADVRRAVLDVAKYYLDLGVDGFRFDAAKYLYFGDTQKNVDFWKWYIAELKKIKPDIYTVAEVWDSDSTTDKFFEALNCFNFSMCQTNGMIADVAKAGDANRLTNYVEQYVNNMKKLRDDAMILPFISNHDMDRAAGYLTPATWNAQFAANLYILGPGSPFIYYGEEIGLRGSRGGEQTDANRRLHMIWGDGDTVKDPEGSTYSADNQLKDGVDVQKAADDSLLNYYKKLIMIRTANPEIARGTYKAVKLSDTKVSGFISTWKDSSVLVLHNPSNSAKTVDLSAIGSGSFTVLKNFIGEGGASVEGGTLTLDSHTSCVLRKPGAIFAGGN